VEKYKVLVKKLREENALQGTQVNLNLLACDFEIGNFCKFVSKILTIVDNF